MTKKAHSKEAIRHALQHPEEAHGAGIYLGDAVYGALDGMVTTFAIVAGVVGANLEPSIILILGFANLIGDGFSMAASNYLSIVSERDYHEQEYKREQWEVEHYPKGEVEEVRQIYRAKGFEGEDLKRAVDIITSDKERWIKTMMLEELGLVPEIRSPLRASMVTFFAFIFCGFLPLLTFMLLYFFRSLEPHAFLLSCLVTMLSIFIVGSLRSLLTAKAWWKAGIEMLLIGGAASTVAYMVGYVLKGIAG